MSTTSYVSTDASFQSRQAGMSLMEMILVILLIAVAVVTALAIFTNAFGASKVQSETQYMQNIVSEVGAMYGTSRDFGTGDITAALISTKAAPAPMIVGSSLRNSWNGTVTVTGASDTFAITTTNVPKKECVKLAQISINPTAVKIGSAVMTLPLQPSAVISACSGDVNTITWNVR